MRRFTLLALGTALHACDDPAAGARIDRVEPSPAQPGEVLVVHGRGFGDDPRLGDGAALGGWPLAPESWSSDRLRFRLAAVHPAGEQWLVLRAADRVLPPFGLRVGGDNPWPGPGAGPPPGRDDAGPPPRDTGSDPDGSLPDATLSGAVVELSPDGDGDRAVELVPLESPRGELRFEVRVRPADEVWGAAFHLAWDPNLLQFVDASPAPQAAGPQALAWGTLGPGRFACGGLVRADGAPLVTLRFAAVGTGEGRLEMPARFSSVRGPGNEPLPGWSYNGGTVRIRDAAP